MFSNCIDQRAERVKTVAHQPWIVLRLPLYLALDEKGPLFALMLPGQYDQMPVFRLVSGIRTQCSAKVRYALKPLVRCHLSAFSGFASMGENFTPGNPAVSQ